MVKRWSLLKFPLYIWMLQIGNMQERPLVSLPSNPFSDLERRVRGERGKYTTNDWLKGLVICMQDVIDKDFALDLSFLRTPASEPTACRRQCGLPDNHPLSAPQPHTCLSTGLHCQGQRNAGSPGSGTPRCC